MLIAYFDCFSGVSGDMILGALIDAGLDLADLQADIDRLGIGARLRASSVDRCGIRATYVEVDIDGQPMTPAGEQHQHTGRHSHDHDHDHNHQHHDHEHGHDHEGGDHQHTHLGDILAIIDASTLAADVKETACRVFRRLTEAEAEVHGRAVEDVGLHEVGSLDAIVDITGAIAGLRRLGVTQVLSSPLHVGTGTVICAHGRYPVPVPGVLALCRNVPLVQTDIESELVTPTGAALITTLAEGYGPAPAMTTVGTGYGAGGRNPATTPNVVRLRLGRCRRAVGRQS
ncbi:MAG: LarC family nickel insertion protein [bacterium]|nr:LarC family nickel insertion protein [bacterium]